MSNSFSKTIEIICSSSRSFDDAVDNGIQGASELLKGITVAWVADQKVTVSDGKLTQTVSFRRSRSFSLIKPLYW